jgi:lipid-A-disaccharide synthase
VPVTVVKDQASEVMAAADLLLVASGTATLQAAIVGTPMILLYKTTLPTYWIARCLVRVKWIGLVNLVAGRSIVPELIQDEATTERLWQEARRLLTDRQGYNAMKHELRLVRDSLGEPGASRRAAEVMLAECRA